MALALTGCGGFVDSIGYFTLYQIYTANMSGNSLAIGTSMLGRHWHRMFERAMPVLFFVVGLCLCVAIMEWMRRKWRRTRLAPVLSLELLFLALFMVLGGWFLEPGRLSSAGHEGFFILLVALAAGAMGIQNIAVTHVGALTIHTTYVTGTLLNFSQNAVWYAYWLSDHARGRGARRWAIALRLAPRQRYGRAALFLAGLWICYVVGAFIAILLWWHIGLIALIAPIAILFVFLLVDMRHPFRPAVSFWDANEKWWHQRHSRCVP